MPSRIRMLAISAIAGLILTVVAATPAAPRQAGGPSRDEEFEKRILAELQTSHPEAVSDFQAANAARDRGDNAKASALYARVREKAPDYVHAIRRQCGAEMSLGHREPAIALCREAVAMAQSSENLATLAGALTSSSGGKAPASKRDLDEAAGLVEQSVVVKPNDAFAQMVRGEVALRRGDWTALSDAAGRLERIAPREIGTQQLRALSALVHRDLSGARAALERARELGLDRENYAQLDELIRRSKPWPLRAAPVVGIVLGSWIAGFLILFVFGAALSSAALRASAEPPAERTGRATGMSEKLLRLYARVLWLCCAYFYVSIPILLVAVIGFGGSVLWAFVALGRIPVKLIILVVVLVFSSVAAIVKSLLARGKDEDPGVRVDLAAEPRLRAVLDEVAARVGTRPVDSVYATPGTGIAVMERGGMLRQMGGQPERCLLVGAAALEGLEQRPFKAILAHEYGHFSNRDTQAGGLALGVRRSLWTMARHLALSGAATWYSPAWWFVRGFHRVFLRISQGASRLQEVLADRWAAFNYGAVSFEKGLSHVIAREVRFQAGLASAVNEAIERKTPVANLYAYRPEKTPSEAEIAEETKKALEADPSPYDSHPSPSHRFEWVRRLSSSGEAPAAPGDASPAWDLFADREAMERRMTQEMRVNLAANYGVALP